MKRLKTLISALVLFLSFGAVSAQEVTQIPLNDWTDDWISRTAALSPDGRAIAAIVNDDLCIFEVESTTSECFTPPQELPIRIIRSTADYNSLVWSWDSQKIAFTEDFYVLLYESDLWVFDRSDGTFTNHTDDGLYGGALSITEENTSLDYLPAFAPDGSVYFFRSDRTSDDNILQLMHFDFETDTVTLIKNLSEPVLSPFSIFYQPRVSPDGAVITFPVLSTRRDDGRNGLWTLELESDELTQVVSMAQLREIFPSPDEGMLTITQPVWTEDRGGIVFRAGWVGNYMLNNYIYIDLASGELTPFIELSDTIVESLRAENNLPLGVGAIYQDQDAFVYLQRSQRDMIQLIQVNLPPVDAPVVLAEFEAQYQAPYTVNPVIGANGNALFLTNLYQLAPDE